MPHFNSVLCALGFDASAFPRWGSRPVEQCELKTGHPFCLWMMYKSQWWPNTYFRSKYLSDFLDWIQNAHRGQCFPASNFLDPRTNILFFFFFLFETKGENHYICDCIVYWTQRQTRGPETMRTAVLSLMAPAPGPGSSSPPTREAVTPTQCQT